MSRDLMEMPHGEYLQMSHDWYYDNNAAICMLVQGSTGDSAPHFSVSPPYLYTRNFPVLTSPTPPSNICRSSLGLGLSTSSGFPSHPSPQSPITALHNTYITMTSSHYKLFFAATCTIGRLNYIARPTSSLPHTHHNPHQEHIK